MNAPPAETLRIPRATYRLQLNRGLPFVRATELVDYLHRLGISDVYCAPIFTAPPESNHGYDVCDFQRINPTLGSPEEFAALAAALKERGMGLLLDFVPNHMGTVPELNPWWRDVLEHGTRSVYRTFFDIDWNPPDLPLHDKVLLPILEDHYDAVLRSGKLRLIFDAGRFHLLCGETRLPLAPRTQRRLFGEVAHRLSAQLPPERANALEPFLAEHIAAPETSTPIGLAELCPDPVFQAAIGELLKDLNEAPGAEHLHELLEEQSYRPAYWRSGSRIANYRRFFDIDSLIAVRMERPEVFAAAHQVLFQLIEAGYVTGLRLDHIDGLADPAGYLRQLQSSIAARCFHITPETERTFFVLVEKITLEAEQLPPDWPVFGTTGYEFARDVTGILVDRGQEQAMTQAYAEFIRDNTPLPTIVRSRKNQVMHLAMSKELTGLARLLHACAQRHRHARDLLFLDLFNAIRETIACLTVYRTYLQPGTAASAVDRERIESAITLARANDGETDALAFEFLKQILLNDPPLTVCEEEFEKRFVTRLQQFTGPVMAKGCEDTVLYVFNRLLALNEVGSDPGTFGLEPAAFHDRNLERLRTQPHTLLATSTHDTKTSDDTRARIAALSQLTAEWTDFLKQAGPCAGIYKSVVDNRPAPDANEEYLFYQVLLGTWPLAPLTSETQPPYAARLQNHMLKALKEAKTHTRWDKSNPQWENAVTEFVAKIISAEDAPFREAFLRLAEQVAELGAINSLSQTLLKLTAPGVPDLYQGSELWQFQLADPDNRTPVDFEPRKHLLTSLEYPSPIQLLENWRDGAIKLFLIRTVLAIRRERPALFETGSYSPLHFDGEHRNSCVGFVRCRDKDSVIVLAPRLTKRVGFPPVGTSWADTAFFPHPAPHRRYRDVFTHRVFEMDGSLALSETFATLPFALLRND